MKKISLILASILFAVSANAADAVVKADATKTAVVKTEVKAPAKK